MFYAHLLSDFKFLIEILSEFLTFRHNRVQKTKRSEETSLSPASIRLTTILFTISFFREKMHTFFLTNISNCNETQLAFYDAILHSLEQS